jgi:FMN phosphatase YigB (HAD superfamily)
MEPSITQISLAFSLLKDKGFKPDFSKNGESILLPSNDALSSIFITSFVKNRFNVIEREGRLDFKKMEIKGVLIDLDDTIFSTTKLFFEKIESAIAALLAEGDINETEFKKVFDEMNKSAHKTHGVRPEPRWEVVKRGLIDRFNINEDRANVFYNKIMEVYAESPEVFQDSLEFLRHISNLKIAFVTHAGEEWTKLKLERLFSMLGVELDYKLIIVPLDGDKNHIHWEQGVNAIDLPKENIIGIGDNLLADVKSLLEAGIVPIHVHRPVTWSVFTKGEVLPPGVFAVKSLTEIIPLLPNT